MSIGFAAENPVGSTGSIQKECSLTSRDLLVASSFQRGLRETVEAALRAKKQGVPTFSITDGSDTPIARICGDVAVAPVNCVSFANSYVAPMALLGAILVVCAHTRTARTLALLRRSELEDRADHRWYWTPANNMRKGESARKLVPEFEKTRVIATNVPSVSLEAAAQDSAPQLRRILGIRDLILMIIGTVIGSGIFLVPGPVLRAVGNSVPWALAVWLTGGVLSLLGALTYGELSARKPQAGGLYIYIHDCFGPFPAFLFGWTLFFVISSGSVATLAVAFGNYLRAFLPLSAFAIKLAAVLMILLITAVNIRGTRQSADVLNVTTLIKVVAILLMSAALLLYGKFPLRGTTTPTSHALAGFSGFGLAMISVLWAYEGWQYATYTAGEALNPQRSFPLAFFAAAAILIGVYLITNYAYVRALGESGVASSTRVAVSALETVIGQNASRLVAVAILVSIFSAANSIMLNSPRVYYAMAKDGLFFRSLSRIHPKFGTPALAVAAAGIWSAVLAATGTFEQLLTYVVFIGWAFYALAAASIFVYRKVEPGVARPYHVPGYPVTPVLFILAALALVGNTMVSQPRRAAVGLVIVFLGAPAYAFWRRPAKLAANENSGRA
jgi:basic amino acid/polyamine antiporter, APA family